MFNLHQRAYLSSLTVLFSTIRDAQDVLLLEPKSLCLTSDFWLLCFCGSPIWNLKSYQNQQGALEGVSSTALSVPSIPKCADATSTSLWEALSTTGCRKDQGSLCSCKVLFFLRINIQKRTDEKHDWNTQQNPSGLGTSHGYLVKSIKQPRLKCICNHSMWSSKDSGSQCRRPSKMERGLATEELMAHGRIWRRANPVLGACMHSELEGAKSAGVKSNQETWRHSRPWAGKPGCGNQSQNPL